MGSRVLDAYQGEDMILCSSWIKSPERWSSADVCGGGGGGSGGSGGSGGDGAEEEETGAEEVII